MEFWSLILTLVAITLSTYYFLARRYSYFKRHGLPYKSAVPLLGSFWPAWFRQKDFPQIIQDVYNVDTEAKYVGFFDSLSPAIMLRDPELIKTVIVKNFDHFPEHGAFIDEDQDPLFGKNLSALKGEQWKEVRTLLSPAFTSSKMKSMFKLMSDCAVCFGDFLATLPADKNVMEMKDAFTRYTNDVIATCAFGVQLDSMRDPDNKFYSYGRKATNFDAIRTLKFFIVRSVPRLCKLIGFRLENPVISQFFKDVVTTTIKTRDEKGIVRPDMIQLMMDTRGKLGPGKELTIEDMTAQAFVFFFGGFESTASAMCFAAHELAVNPEFQQKLRDEIDQVLEDNNGQVTYEAINDMKYLDAVVNEALRLYPVSIVTDRQCTKPFELPPALPGLKPLVVEPGTAVWVPLYGIQRDPKYFEEPEKYNPDRFLDDPKKTLNSGVYFPFGMGPRMCIANRFALLEIKVLLFHLLARCNLKPCSKTPVPMVFSKIGLFLSAENGFWLQVERRSTVHPSVMTPVANGSSVS